MFAPTNERAEVERLVDEAVRHGLMELDRQVAVSAADDELGVSEAELGERELSLPDHYRDTKR